MSILKVYKTFNEISILFLKERNISLKYRTYKGYVGRINLFNIYLKNNKLDTIPLRKLSNVDISNFFVYLIKDRNLDKPTCQKYYITLTKVWKYAIKLNEYNKQELPFNLVVFPNKKGDFSPDLIPKNIFNILINDIKRNDYELYVAAMIQYYAFIRPNCELRKLKTDDFDFVKNTIKVSETIAKTKVTRYVTITIELLEILLEYGIKDAPKNKYIFGKKHRFDDSYIGINNFSYRFRYFRKKHNLDIKVKFYSFKHTGITDMLNSGVPLISVQWQAGHFRLSSTQHYAKKYGDTTDINIINYKRPIK